MNEEQFSCIKQVVKTVQLPLPSSFIANEVAGISEILDSWKRQYMKQLHGVVVDYKNVSLTSRTGFIGISKPFVFYYVKATFDLFCPNVGDIVKGKINRISREHIGCLIQGTINVTIHLSENSSSELSQFMHLNQEILFEISHFDYERKMIRVRGKITPECIQLMKDMFPPEETNNENNISQHVKYNFSDVIGSNSKNSTESNDIKQNVLSNNSKNVISMVKIKKTKSSKKHKRESESSFLETSDISTADEMPKKKSTEKVFSPSEKEFEINDIKSEKLSDNSQSVFNLRESESSLLETSDFSTADEMPKKKSTEKVFSLSEKEFEINDRKSEMLPDNSQSVPNMVKDKKGQSSKKRKRESESNFSSADKMPKEKRKISLKNEIISLNGELKDLEIRKNSLAEFFGKLGKESKNEEMEMAHGKKKKSKEKDQTTASAQENNTSIMLSNDLKKKKKHKGKKSATSDMKSQSKKSKLKKKKKILASGNIKKDKKLNDKKSKKHKGSKSVKKKEKKKHHS
ncbi:DNA-directed RNA polymerase I subunit RPA43 [Nephila pilipes]|uniref:DNA-directed RNA polymerase I subunit RPA43 n=1 Tax=Nephila pilipes TaxID=299642 RepID=A0A8X6TTY9_NEPPI|nr:DNA-directed RNA polymerase I subunit RPA43 [Nephila pilipes]